MAGKDEGFGIVYRIIMRDKRLTAEAKAIYAYLSSFAGERLTCYPSVELMCAELNFSEARFSKHMRILVDAGIVQKERQRKENRFGRNIYTLNHSTHFLPIEKEGLENERIGSLCVANTGVNNKSFKNTSFNMNRIEELSVRVCELLNIAKRKASSKGRLRQNEWAVQKLLEDGYSAEDILSAAQKLADDGIEVCWYDFPEYVSRYGRK